MTNWLQISRVTKYDPSTKETPEGALAKTQAAKDDLAQRLGYSDFAEMVAQAVAGQTLIVGGLIRTSLLDADAVILAGSEYSGVVIDGTNGLVSTASVGGNTIQLKVNATEGISIYNGANKVFGVTTDGYVYSARLYNDQNPGSYLQIAPDDETTGATMLMMYQVSGGGTVPRKKMKFKTSGTVAAIIEAIVKEAGSDVDGVSSLSVRHGSAMFMCAGHLNEEQGYVRIRAGNSSGVANGLAYWYAGAGDKVEGMFRFGTNYADFNQFYVDNDGMKFQRYRAADDVYRVFNVPMMQSGTVTLNETSETTVTFPVSFPGTPRVILTPQTTTGGVIAGKVRSKSATEFKAITGGSAGTGSNAYDWIAIYGAG